MERICLKSLAETILVLRKAISHHILVAVIGTHLLLRMQFGS